MLLLMLIDSYMLYISIKKGANISKEMSFSKENVHIILSKKERSENIVFYLDLCARKSKKELALYIFFTFKWCIRV